MAMTRALAAVPALLVALAACEPVPAPGNPDTCGASGLSELIGQDAEAVAAGLSGRPIRIIRPGDMVTMDFDPSRINVRLDENDRVDSIACG